MSTVDIIIISSNENVDASLCAVDKLITIGDETIYIGGHILHYENGIITAEPDTKAGSEGTWKFMILPPTKLLKELGIVDSDENDNHTDEESFSDGLLYESDSSDSKSAQDLPDF